jgi:pimeloyl-ACP methyl ester carboxylesterase
VRAPILPPVSTPPFLRPPPGTRLGSLTTSRGEFAAWVLAPEPAQLRGTAVLVPGFTGSKEDFVAILGPLAADGWRTVAYDQRGQHETPGTHPDAYSMEALAADLLALINGLDAGPVHLLGHSFGGLVAREAVLLDPSSVRSLTLLSSGPRGVDGTTAEVAHLFAAALESMPIDQVWDAKVSYDAAQGLRLPDDETLAAFLRNRFVANDPAGLAAFARLLTSAPDRTEELAASRVPVLVAYGAHDDAWPPQVQASMAQRLGARHEVVDDAGHSPAAEAPDITAAVLSEFWLEAQRAA